LVNNGLKMKPHLVREVMDVETKSATPVAKEPIGQLPLTAENIDFIRKTLVGVNIEGTSASSFAGAPYTSGGKTGTAQVFTVKQNEKYNAARIDERLRDHALFMAYAPAEEPRIVLAMVVENAGFGAQNAAPIARRVFDFVIQGLYPAEEDILAVQRGQATRPTGKPREVATMPWPPRPAAPKVDLPTDAKAAPSSPLGARSAPTVLGHALSTDPASQRGLRLAQTLSE
jgi:penicillin-binding protein 2